MYNYEKKNEKRAETRKASSRTGERIDESSEASWRLLKDVLNRGSRLIFGKTWKTSSKDD